ncbi:MAG TPA: NAD-dependent epimerase/dehydratase family protein [Vicinamibacteria bacterium]|nr:NAD-dependent epimerase/dehydratase family protein [Vicinamibacteria bacterium]
MTVAIVTGAAGLIGAESVRLFAAQGFDVVGIDNDMRRYFFGDEASTAWSRERLEADLSSYVHLDVDIRDEPALDRAFRRYGKNIELVIHAAAQPSHDWAAREPITDFDINAKGTLTLLEQTRRHCPEAVFVYVSTNKVYGDRPNRLPLVEQETRWELDPSHRYAKYGIDESMSVDDCMHSLFGVSKIAGDLLVQEYGRYFEMRTVCLRCGCLTGPGHSGAQLHGFLAYLVHCAITGRPYTVFGYKGKQVRDNIHSYDLAQAFWQIYRSPRSGAIYNMGGSRFSNCSVLEAIVICEQLTGRPMNWAYAEGNRMGDHVWWISDIRKFESDYPAWKLSYDLRRIIAEIHEAHVERRLDASQPR